MASQKRSAATATEYKKDTGAIASAARVWGEANHRNTLMLCVSHRIITKKWRLAKMDYESEIDDLKERVTKLEKSVNESIAELKSLLDQIRFENDRRDLESLSLR
ncbi:MAG: hypothetical protein WB581_07390 [Halobacteriota archaeon]